MIASLLISAAIGVVVGILSGLLGIGGGTVMVPLFRLLYGMSAFASTATSLFTIIPTSVSGAVAHMRNRSCVPKLGLIMGVGGAATSPVGVWLAQLSPAWLVMLAAAAIIGYSAINMFKKAFEMKPARAVAVALGAPCATGVSGAADGPHDDADASFGSSGAVTPDAPDASDDDADALHKRFARLGARRIACGAAIGMVAGLASGYVGVGGGFIMVPLMLSFLDVPMKLASGTSLVAVMLLAIPGTVAQALLFNIDYLAGVTMAAGSIPGAVLGAKLVKRVPERALRLAFGSFLLVAAALLFLNEVGPFG